MKLNFMQRIGKERIELAMQLDSLNYATCNELWTYTYRILFDNFNNWLPVYFPTDTNKRHNIHYIFFENIWCLFLKEDISRFREQSFPKAQSMVEFQLRKLFLSNNNNLETLYFIEWLLEKLNQTLSTPFRDFKNISDFIIENYNSILANNRVGYRIIDNLFTPIVEEVEIQEIKNIIDITNDKFFPVKDHIKNAITTFSNKENPDYKNAIKESILAIESMCQIIIGEKGSLSKLIQRVQSKVKINDKFAIGIKSIYDYTSSDDGIRHGLMEVKDGVKQEDAKFMIVLCSAFVNYLISKYDLIKDN